MKKIVSCVWKEMQHVTLAAKIAPGIITAADWLIKVHSHLFFHPVQRSSGYTIMIRLLNRNVEIGIKSNGHSALKLVG